MFPIFSYGQNWFFCQKGHGPMPPKYATAHLIGLNAGGGRFKSIAFEATA